MGISKDTKIARLTAQTAALKKMIKVLQPKGRCGVCRGDWEECGCACDFSGLRRMVCSCCSWTRRPKATEALW